MKSRVAAVIISIVLLVSTGCSRIVRWGKCTFAQAARLCIDISPACAYVRTIRQYDQFNTVALFDVLWLSDTVREIYSALYAAEHCRSPEQTAQFLRRQLQENDHFISFYVLMPQNKESALTYNGQRGIWSVCLVVNGVSYAPREIKVIDLAPEYRIIFGNRYNNFKVPYLVQFDALDLHERQIITATTQKIQLCFISAKYTISVEWPDLCCGTLSCNTKTVL